MPERVKDDEYLETWPTKPQANRRLHYWAAVITRAKLPGLVYVARVPGDRCAWGIYVQPSEPLQRSGHYWARLSREGKHG